MASRSLRSSLCCLFFSALLVFLAPLGVAGCGAPDAGLASSSASPSSRTTTAVPPASPSPDPRPTPASSAGPARNLPRPALPEAAKQNTQEGFAAFTQYWFDTVTYARETGDTEPLRAASLPTCKMCQLQITKASEIHAGGGWSVGPVRTVRRFETDLLLDPNRNAVGYFFLDESGSATFSSDGSIFSQYPAATANGSQTIYAHFDGMMWITAEAGRA